MLYVSRRIYPEKYGVYDTEDNVEEVVDGYTFDKYCIDLGVDIKGVDIVNSYVDIVQRIAPYQPVETLSQKQIKLKMLTGVNIKVWRGSITSIWWDDTPVSEPVRIRLSDFAGKIADCVFLRETNIGFHKVTLVLDDNIDVRLRSFDVMETDDIFEGKDGIGVAIDVRDVKDYQRLKLIYRSFVHDAYQDLSSSIIDDERRKRRMLKAVVR